ncbi:hypothetical protein BJF91_08625 [Allorhizobium taibaishanense]|nr:hypothetical protein BJF91_08625 [Allorhizobium taibaishanense]
MAAGTALDIHGTVELAQAEPPQEELPKQKKKDHQQEEGQPGEARPPQGEKPQHENKRPEPPAEARSPAREEAPAQPARPKPPAAMEAPVEPPQPPKHEKAPEQPPREPAQKEPAQKEPMTEPQKAPQPPKMAEPPAAPAPKPKKQDAEPPMQPAGEPKAVPPAAGTRPAAPAQVEPQAQPPKGAAPKGNPAAMPEGQAQPGEQLNQRPAGKKPGTPPPAEAPAPQGQPVQGQAPQGQAPQGQPPKGQPPKNQAPQNQAPPGQPPEAQKPQAPKPGEPPRAPDGKSVPEQTPGAPATPAPTGKAPVSEPALPGQAAPAPIPGQVPGQPAPAQTAPGQGKPPAPGTPPAPHADAPVPPPPPGPGNAEAGKPRPPLLPPMNANQSREQGGLPGQGGQGGQGGQPGKGGQPGQPGQPGRPGMPGDAAVNQDLRPQLSPQDQQPLTPKELQRLKALADRPDQTNDTIILPIDRGAPVLDSDKDNNWRRGMNEDQLRRLRQQAYGQDNYVMPQSDAEAQREYYANRPRRDERIESIDHYEGRKLRDEPQFIYPSDVRVERSFDDDREVMDYGGQIVIRSDDNRRFAEYGRPPVYEQVDHQRVRITVFKENGDRIVSLRNRYGQLIQRSRIDARGNEYVLFYSPDLYDANDDQPVVYRDPGAELPPMRLRVPLNDYIIDVGSQPDRDYYRFIEQPPVEPVERVYTIDEVRNSARIRDKMRRIDLDTITFATASADISMNQAGTLKRVADAITRVLKDDPGETFLIEGHTDAVGSAESNLVLSDRRAESVANVLTQVYGIPPENMVTQGYGEQFLKVMTYGPEQQNRRVTIRRVTPLVRPVQANR